MKAMCSVDGCGRPKNGAEGYCVGHRSRFREWGDATAGPPIRNRTLKADFTKLWERVDKSGGPDACWPWTGGLLTGRIGRRKNAYGAIKIADGRTIAAHRVAFEEAGGDGSRYVWHTCGNSLCCNPAHLRNAEERVYKWKKLTDEDAEVIRRMSSEGIMGKDLAELYGVDKGAISKIINGVSHCPKVPA